MRAPCLALLTLTLVACDSAGRDQPITTAERDAISAEIERTLRETYDLSRPGLADRMLALYPTSGRVVSATGGEVVTSRDTLTAGIRYFWENVGRNMRNPRWEWRDFYVDVLSRDAAVATATYHIPHRNPRDEPHDLGGAMTVVFARQDGRWVIIQEHLSDQPQPADGATTATHEHD